MLLDGINLELKRLITKFQTPLITCLVPRRFKTTILHVNSSYAHHCFLQRDAWVRGRLITTKTIFARHYGTAAVISYNLKGIAPPVPPVQCWIDKTWCLVARRQHWNGWGEGGWEKCISKWYITTECMWKLDCLNSILSKIVHANSRIQCNENSSTLPDLTRIYLNQSF
jgi:hypothetical protein